MFPKNPSFEKYNKEKECTRCNMYTSTYAVMYTMYTRYTTFRICLSKNHNSIKQLSKKAITHYVVNSIYRYSKTKRFIYNIPTFFKKQISKVSTLLTSCIHEVVLDSSEIHSGYDYDLYCQNFSSVQHTHVTCRWVVCGDLYYHNGIYWFYYKYICFGDDYEV